MLSVCSHLAILRLGMYTTSPAEIYLVKEPVMNWMLASLQNPYVETLTPDVMVLGGGVFERQLGCEGRTLVNGISVLAIRDLTELSASLCHVRTG